MEKEQIESWSSLHEMLASQTELLSYLVSRVEAGIPVGMVSKFSKVDKPQSYPRPEWISGRLEEAAGKVGNNADGVRVIRLRDLGRTLRTGV